MPEEGGGIQNRGMLTIAHSILRVNTAGSGGAIFNTGTLTITNSTLSANTAGDGGAHLPMPGMVSVCRKTPHPASPTSVFRMSTDLL